MSDEAMNALEEKVVETKKAQQWASTRMLQAMQPRETKIKHKYQVAFTFNEGEELSMSVLFNYDESEKNPAMKMIVVKEDFTEKTVNEVITIINAVCETRVAIFNID